MLRPFTTPTTALVSILANALNQLINYEVVEDPDDDIDDVVDDVLLTDDLVPGLREVSEVAREDKTEGPCGHAHTQKQDAKVIIECVCILHGALSE